jgi:long-chain acyl-CoA synthetase
MLIGSHLQAHAQSDRTALIEEASGDSLTYRQLWSCLGSVATMLARRGIRPGDVVSLCSGNSIDYAVNLYGVICYGAIANPIDPASPPARISGILEHSQSRLALSDRTLELDGYAGEVVPTYRYRREVSAPALLERAGDPATRPALLIYTSGTTGQPKGVLLTQANVLNNVATAQQHLPLGGPDHRALCLLPLFHVHGLISDLSTMLLRGACAVIMPSFDVSHAERIERAIAVHEIASFSCVPLVLDFLTGVGLELRSERLRFAVSGAAPLDPELPARVAAEYGFEVIPAYGMTECTNYCTITPSGRRVAGSVGLAAGCEIRVAGDDGRDVARGEIGELLIRGPSVMSGNYFKRQDDSPFVGDAWLRSGDLGYQSGDGFVFIKGRKKNMAIRGGHKIYLDDVDHCLRSHPWVRDVASVRLDRETHDEVVTFAVAREADRAEESLITELARHVERELGSDMRPDRVLACASIPRTASNKVRIAELQARAAEAAELERST